MYQEKYCRRPKAIEAEIRHEAEYARIKWIDYAKNGLKGEATRQDPLTNQEWNDLMAELKEFGAKELKYKTVRANYTPYSYYFLANSEAEVLITEPIYTDEGLVIDYDLKIYYSHLDDDKNNSEKVKGWEAFQQIDEIFKERTGKKIKEVFGTLKGNDKYFMDDFQLPPFIFINENYVSMKIKGVSKADVSSAYPGAFINTPLLPNAAKAKKVKGRVAPTTEYPFAFYSDHHMAIFNELDTRDWIDLKMDGWEGWKKAGFKKDKDGKFILDKNKKKIRTGEKKPMFLNIKEDEIETLLMPAAFENLAPEMETLYRAKSEEKDETAKQVMVSFIGYMRSTENNTYGYLGHLSAVCYARHLKNMIDAYQFLVENGNEVLSIATDSIAWFGPSYLGSLTTTEKKAGNLVLEADECEFYMKGCGQYCLMDPKTKEIKAIKHQALKTEKIIGVEINEVSDIEKWDKVVNEIEKDSFIRIFNPKTHLFEDKERM